MFDWIAEGILKEASLLIQNFVGNVCLSMGNLAWSMLESAFGTEQLTAGTWDTVSGPDGSGFIHTWIAIMAPVLVAVVCIQAAWSALRRNKAGIIRAGVGATLGIPASLLAVWLMEKISIAMDEVTAFISNQMGSTPIDAFMKAFGFKPLDKPENDFGYEIDPEHWIWWVSGPQGAMILGVLMMVLVAIAAIVLNVMMIFRGFALIVAAALAPVVIMMMPWEASKSWFTKWAELVTGLLIAKPLAFSVLMFSMMLFESSEGVTQTMMGLVGMVLAALMPLLAMKFISFTPANSTSDMDAGGKSAAQAPARLATTMVRSRALTRRR